jgi:prepilin-type N-terminal cleavage/methylation domain-containing protein
MNKSNKRSGFSLIEVIFAISVIAIAVIGILSVMLVSVRLQEAARETDLASNSAREQIERIRGTNFATIQATFGGTNFTVPGLPDAAGNSNGVNQGAVTITPLAGDLLDIQVTVTWRSATGADSQTRLFTQIFNNTP